MQWSPPEFHNRNGDLIGYVIRIFGIRDSSIGNVTIHTVGALNASTSYSFAVAARTVAGLGPFSKPVYVRTLEGGKCIDSIHFTISIFSIMCPESPAPVGVSAMRISATQIRVSWPKVSKDGANSPILSYTVKYYTLSSDSRSRREIDVKFINTDTNVTINDLVPILEYGVAVAANTAYGMGTFSEAITVGCESSFLQCNLEPAFPYIQCQRTVSFSCFLLEKLTASSGL